MEQNSVQEKPAVVGDEQAIEKQLTLVRKPGKARIIEVE